MNDTKPGKWGDLLILLFTHQKRTSHWTCFSLGLNIHFEICFFLKYTTTLKWPKNYVKPRIWNIQVSMTWNVNEHVKSRRINTCVCQQLMINWWWKLVKVVQKPLNLGSDVSFYCKDSAPRYHFFLTPFTLRESWTCLTNESTRGKKAGF